MHRITSFEKKFQYSLTLLYSPSRKLTFLYFLYYCAYKFVAYQPFITVKQ